MLGKEKQRKRASDIGRTIIPCLRTSFLFIVITALSLIIQPSPGIAGRITDFFSGKQSIATVKAEFDLAPNDTSAIDWSPDGKYLAVSGILNPYVKVFDVQNKTLVMTLRKLAGGSHGLAYSPDGRFLAAGNSFTQMIKGVSVHIWDAKTGALLKNITGPYPIDKPANSVTYLAFSPDGRYLAVGYDGNFPKPGANIYLYDTDTWRPTKFFGDSVSTIDGGLLFSPDGRLIVHGTIKGKIRIWDVANGKLVREINAHPAYHIYALSFTPDAKWLASCTQRGATVIGKDDRTGQFIEPKGEYQNVRIWDTETGKLIKGVGDFGGGVWTLRFSPDGSKLAIGANKQIQIWAVNGWQLLGALHIEGLPSTVHFNPDNNYLAVGARGAVTVWEMRK